MAASRFRNFGIGFTGNLPVREAVGHVMQAEKGGFGSSWFADDYFPRSGIQYAAAAALSTEKVTVAISVVNPYTRHPVLIAMEVATLDELSGGRAIFGLGAGVDAWMMQMGYPYDRNLQRIREVSGIVEALLSGKKTSFKSELYEVKEIKLDFQPVRSAVPLYIGAMGPKMLELSGEIADGVILSIMCSVPYLEFVKEHLEIGAKRTRRDLKGYDIVGFLPFAVDSDGAKARDAMRPFLAFYLRAMTDHILFRSAGVTEEHTRPIVEAFEKGGTGAEQVTDELVNKLSVAGTPEECVRRLRAFLDAGVTTPVPIFIPGTDIGQAVRLISERVIPEFKKG